MSKPDTKRQVTVTLRLERGLGSPAQNRAWQRFWQRLVTEAKQSKQEGADHRLSFLRAFSKS